MAEATTRELLDAELKRQFKLMSQTTDKDACERYAQNLEKLYKMKLEEEKLDLESDDKAEKLNLEEEKLKFEEKKLDLEEKNRREDLERQDQDRKDTQRDRTIRYVIEGVGIVLPIVFYGIWMKRGFKFEETGHFTSNTFKSLTNKFKPTKK